jgi:hypothetical protein
MRLFDGCCGLKGISSVFEARGWDVISLDIEPQFNPTIVADIRDYHYTGPRPDLMWFSPPCDQFAKFGMPCWYDSSTLPDPDMSILEACIRIIKETKPTYWMIENVKGAIPFFSKLLGKPREMHRPFYLWGYFPPLSYIDKSRFSCKEWVKKGSSPTKAAARARIPEILADAIARAVEYQTSMELR